MSSSSNLAPGRIRIRMYRVGFGDCFLVSLPVGEKHRHVLVDCGVHAQANIGTIEQVIADIAGETDGRIAIVVASHRHQDHISGFAVGEQAFGRVEVDEVWLPWSEDPGDKYAQTLREKRFALVAHLRLQLAAAAAPRQEDVEHILQNATGIDSRGVAFAGGNDRAMAVLRSGFDGNPKVRYLKAGDALERPAALAGLSVRVLGPPHDETYLRQMDPPKPDRYLAARAAAGGGGARTSALRPFQASRVVPKGRLPRGASRLSTQDEKALHKQASSPLNGLAFALDQAINNTSLVLLLSYRGKTLLFPGDAQYGNWRFWLDKPDTASLLGEVAFYKVSHHGSVNATPKRAVAGLPRRGFAAMVSTQSLPWPSIPRGPLMTALAAASTGLFRSDSIPIQDAPDGPPVTRMPRGFHRGPFWVDYVME